MKRFSFTDKPYRVPRLVPALLLFAGILAAFFLAVNSFSGDTTARQKQLLETAIARNITHCYSVEGAYPESLDYLKENYGLTYDESRFFVDYRVQGANILPDVTILERGSGE